MKALKPIALLFVLVLIAGGVYLYMNYANLLKNQVEKIASNALNVRVSISSLDLSISEKMVTVSGIKIANPAGYEKSNAVTIGSVSVALAEIPETLDLIKFKLVDVSDTNVNLEVTGTNNNLSDLKNGMSKSSGSSSSPSSSDANQPKVTLQKFHINQSTLNPTVTLIGGDLSPVNIPPVTLTGIGTKENGILAKDAIKQILTQYLNIASKQANSAGFLEGLSGVNIEDVKQQAKDKIEGEIGDKIGDKIGGDVKNKLGTMFGQ
jgi:hypothetical protein